MINLKKKITLHWRKQSYYLYNKNELIWGCYTFFRYIPDIGAYKFHTQKTDWNTARKICEEEGGYLAIINSIAESEALGLLLRNSDPYLFNAQVDDAGYAHIGFHELFKTDDWTTIHGESLSVAGFFVWSPGEPNRRGNQQHCGSIYKDGKLNDIECWLHMNFICELPRVSFSSIIVLPETGAAQTFPFINPRSGWKSSDKCWSSKRFQVYNFSNYIFWKKYHWLGIHKNLVHSAQLVRKPWALSFLFFFLLSWIRSEFMSAIYWIHCFEYLESHLRLRFSDFSNLKIFKYNQIVILEAFFFTKCAHMHCVRLFRAEFAFSELYLTDFWAICTNLQSILKYKHMNMYMYK